MRLRITRSLVLLAFLCTLVQLFADRGSASHESTSALEFAPVSGAAFVATGEGIIEFHGGAEPESRWTVSFAFSGLQPGAAYTVVDEGRFGEDGSAEATMFTPLCEFQSDRDGSGGCWNYLFGLRRANVLQLRLGDVAGSVVLQATREPDGPGSITSVPNRFSPSPTAVATPRALPTASPKGG